MKNEQIAREIAQSAIGAGLIAAGPEGFEAMDFEMTAADCDFAIELGADRDDFSEIRSLVVGILSGEVK